MALTFEKSLDRITRHVPELAEAQHTGLFVHPQVAPAFPALGLADGADHGLQRRGYVVCLGDAAGHHVLQSQQLFRALARGDVLGDAAIAREAPPVEHRLPAAADIPHFALVIDASGDEVCERLPRFEQGLVSVPAPVIADRDRVKIPACGPDVLLRIEARLPEARADEQGETVALVLLPVPLRRKLEDDFQALFSQALRVAGALLAHRGLIGSGR